jgi:aldose 1-epimerase
VAFRVRTEALGRVEGLDPTVYILEGGGERADIWPAQGFNCFRWTAHDGELDVLYADPQFLEGSSPTRTGIPVLFPFPNRIRAGRFSWNGKDYQLPLNDPAKKNAIHGFACRRPWHVVDRGADEASAWITGEFQGWRDAPECRALWPADYRLRLTYRLGPRRLRLEAVVDNPDQQPLPFGLGYHPYFLVEGKACSVSVPAESYWELEECLPSGKVQPVDSRCDLRKPRPLEGLELDDVLSRLVDRSPTAEGFCRRGQISLGWDKSPTNHSSRPETRVTLVDTQGRTLGYFLPVPSERRKSADVQIHTSPAFREAVVFTPPHRKAFCIEPYTCTTDAINLQQRSVDAGLLVLQPGETWSGVVPITV